MSKEYKLALYIFRRDLRLHDNSALNQALANAEAVIPCFIFDDRQIKSNTYKSDHSLQFMHDSLLELKEALSQKKGCLYFAKGVAEKIIHKLLSDHPIDAIFINQDYTPFSKKRDAAIENYCKKANVAFNTFTDLTLHHPDKILKNDHTPYTVFTPYLRKAKLDPVSTPQKLTHGTFKTSSLTGLKKTLPNIALQKKNSDVLTGGRKAGLQLLAKIKKLTNYDHSRQIPGIVGTSFLSAHHKFGTLSIREVYHHIEAIFNKDHTLITELHWRDFFIQICHHFPHVMGDAFKKKYSTVKWQKNKALFAAWCEGRTGFPIVDAGMRQLNQTGYMHNRVRMITASFLCKDLHIDWREGEKYFATQLTDYDPMVNNGNWQWAASTGCDAQPYFRVFNPWLQQKKFDPDCEYIKLYVPELDKISAKLIHSLDTDALPPNCNYPKPIVNHQKESLYTRKHQYKTK